MAILVGNLPSEITQDNLSSLFTKYGTVKINIFPEAGYAVVELKGKEDEINEERLIQELNDAEHFGQKLQLFKSAVEESAPTRNPMRQPPPPPKPSK